MIPKIIHYCWFGAGPLSDDIKKCIESWKKYCPGYEIKEWNESSFDINSNTYVREAYEAKKWAFVTDYVRLYALYTQGGFYMDTDVELLKSLDFLCAETAFSGFEDDTHIPTALMGSEKNGEWVKYLLSYYDDKCFIKSDGSFDLTTNVDIITGMTRDKYKIKLNNTYQRLDNVLTIYPKDFFCPKSYITQKITLTENTVCIHHFSASWFTEEKRLELEQHRRYVKKYGKIMRDMMFKADNFKKNIYKAVKSRGLGGSARYCIKKLMRKLTKTGNVLFFETEGDFCDNGRVLYEYLIENGYNKKYKIIWSVKNRRSYDSPKNVKFICSSGKIGRLKAEYYAGKSKYLFFTHPYWFTDRKSDQTVINLWHGIGLKGGGNDLSDSFDYISISSEKTKHIFTKTLGTKNNQFIITGTPRLDLLFRKTNLKERMAPYLADIDYSKIILCMPTFRQSKLWSDSDSIDKYSINTITSKEELEALNEYLRANNEIMIIKVHHLQDLKFIETYSLSNIIYLKDEQLLSCDIQLYELVAQTDALLTDYSSISYDYLLLNRPIGFLVADIEQYSRGFVTENPFDFMPGEKIYNNEELYKFLDNVKNGVDDYKKQRKEILDFIDEYQDSNNCKRIVEYLKL